MFRLGGFAKLVLRPRPYTSMRSQIRELARGNTSSGIVWNYEASKAELQSLGEGKLCKELDGCKFRSNGVNPFFKSVTGQNQRFPRPLRDRYKDKFHLHQSKPLCHSSAWQRSILTISSEDFEDILLTIQEMQIAR